MRTFAALVSLRRLVRLFKPDIVVSFETWVNVVTLIALFKGGVPVVISERGDPQGWTVRPLVKFLRRLAYRFATALVLPASQMQEALPKNICSRIIVIPNPVVPPPTVQPRRISALHPVKIIVALGRLTHEKGCVLPASMREMTILELVQ